VMEGAEPSVLRNLISGNAAEGIRVRGEQLKERMAGNFFGTGTTKPNKGGAVAVVRAGAR